MKRLTLILLLAATFAQTSCVQSIWMEAYRRKGGYYEKLPEKPRVNE